MEETGSEPLRGRKERFAVLLAEGGLTQVQAYCQSVTPIVEPTPGRQVAASRLSKEVAARVAFLKRQRAADAAPSEELNLEDLGAIMAGISDVLIESAAIAELNGHVALSAALRRAAVTHVNRAGRVQRVQGDAPDKAESFDACGALERIICQCS